MTQRHLTLVNNSGSPTGLIVFQGFNHSPSSVAWLGKYAYPGTQVQFSWDDSDYCFVWAGSGQLGPDVVLQVAQTVPAQPNEGNQINLSYDAQNHVFFLHDQQTGQPAGQFQIRSDSTLPVGAASAGIGMAGKPTFVIGAQPNINLQISPPNAYYLASGNYQQGQYLQDVSALKATELVFPINVNAMTATLNPDLSWTIVADILQVAEDKA